MTNEFKFPCPHCKQNLQCDVQLAGRQIQCPSCDHLINIPNPLLTADFVRIPRPANNSRSHFSASARKIQ